MARGEFGDRHAGGEGGEQFVLLLWGPGLAHLAGRIRARRTCLERRGRLAQGIPDLGPAPHAVRAECRAGVGIEALREGIEDFEGVVRHVGLPVIDVHTMAPLSRASERHSPRVEHDMRAG